MKTFWTSLLLFCFLNVQSQEFQGIPEVLFIKKDSLLNEPFEEFDVEGCFLICKIGAKEERVAKVNNLEWIYHQTTPASTYKIPNSMIGLETGVIQDENFVIKWDSIERWNKNWNQDTDLKMAYRNSTVWYYQRLAERVGQKSMQKYLDTLVYGNQTIGDELNAFWLDGSLKISPVAQLIFLEKLIRKELPISERTYDIMDKIMVYDNISDAYVIKAKTGWGFEGKENIGWFIGILEVGEDRYAFVSFIKAPEGKLKNFAKTRIDIAYQNLRKMKLIP